MGPLTSPAGRCFLCYGAILLLRGTGAVSPTLLCATSALIPEGEAQERQYEIVACVELTLTTFYPPPFCTMGSPLQRFCCRSQYATGSRHSSTPILERTRPKLAWTSMRSSC